MPRPRKKKHLPFEHKMKKISEWEEVFFSEDNPVLFRRSTYTLHQGGNLQEHLLEVDGTEKHWEERCADFSAKTRASAIFLYLLKNQKSAVPNSKLLDVLAKHPNTSPSSRGKLAQCLDSTIRGLNKKFNDRGIRVAILSKNRAYRFSVPIRVIR